MYLVNVFSFFIAFRMTLLFYYIIYVNKMKRLRILGIGLLAVIPFLTLKAQKALTPQDLQDWKRITTRAISDD